MTNTSLLREAVRKAGLKCKKLAAALGITPYGLQKKVKNCTEFKASEILILSELLGLSEKERTEIFFWRDR